MPKDSLPELTFSERTGTKPVPPQLKLHEASDELRRLLHYALLKDAEADIRYGYEMYSFDDRWETLSRDLLVRRYKVEADKTKNDPSLIKTILRRGILEQPYDDVFDLVEFVIRHPNCGLKTRVEVGQAFVDSRAAYRLIDGRTIVAIGTQEQGEAFMRALDDAEENSAAGARKHLVDAGVALKEGDWAGCVRESIHAVESVAKRLAPGADTLGPALKVIDKNGHLHGSLKVAFDKLYGYSCDEDGVRHARVFDEAEAKVDEADALFMLGACASFVSYLLARGGAA